MGPGGWCASTTRGSEALEPVTFRVGKPVFFLFGGSSSYVGSYGLLCCWRVGGRQLVDTVEVCIYRTPVYFTGGEWGAPPFSTAQVD